MSRYCIVQQMLPLAARTTGGQTSGFDFGDAIESLIMVEVTAATGTGKQLDLIIQTSHDNTNWFDHSTIATITDTGNYIDSVTQYGKYIRLSYAISGTTPSFTFKITAVRKT
jgi:hypothetical protein